VVINLPAGRFNSLLKQRLLTLDVNQGRSALFIFARVFAKAISYGVSRSALLGV
jgi:hypothetical protein